MIANDLKKYTLSDEPGVYFFLGPKHEILYIGKATSLRNRVRSYFANTIGDTRGERIVEMLAKATRIKHRQTDSVLEALVLEVALIKKHQPPYNVRSRDDKSFDYVVITNEQFPKVMRVRGKTLAEDYPAERVKHVFGPFPSAQSLRQVLHIVRKIFPYRDERCTPGQGRPCFNQSIGLCPGMCIGTITEKRYAKTIAHLALFFEGETQILQKKLERDMASAARQQRFEYAHEYKRQLFALKHIQDVSLIASDARSEAIDGVRPGRLEAYDIAHTAGTNVVGVMVVSEDGEFKKADYRKFIIRINPKNDDPGSLRELIERRLRHPEWPLPIAMIVDGTEVQQHVVIKALAQRNLVLPVIAVTKNDKHTARELRGDQVFAKQHEKAIITLNAEAHRYAITFHRYRRGKSFIAG